MQIIIDPKQLENVEYFKYLGSIRTNISRWTREIKARIVTAKASFNQKDSFYLQIGL
jgi:hypothetical protein